MNFVNNFIYKNKLTNKQDYYKFIQQVMQILKIIVDEDKCIACGNCKEICPKGGYIWTIGEVASVSNLDYCHVCTLCAMKCGPDAIKIERNAPDE